MSIIISFLINPGQAVNLLLLILKLAGATARHAKFQTLVLIPLLILPCVLGVYPEHFYHQMEHV